MITNEMLKSAKNGEERVVAEIMQQVYGENMNRVLTIYRRFSKTIFDLDMDEVQLTADEVAWDVIRKVWWKRDDRNPSMFVDFVWSIVIKRLCTLYNKKVGKHLSEGESKTNFKNFTKEKMRLEDFLLSDESIVIDRKYAEKMEGEIDEKCRIDKVKNALAGQWRLLDIFVAIVDEGLTVKEISIYYDLHPQTIRNDISKINRLASKILF